MGVSFNISRQGKRYMHKQQEQLVIMDEENEIVMNEENEAATGGDFQTEEMESESGGNVVEVGNAVTAQSIVLAKPKSGLQQLPEDLEVSFALNLFTDGFSVGKANEEVILQLLRSVPQMLHPYNRASKKLFSAIEYGYLPGDYFDDLPCKYVNGALLCEVRDFRNCLIQTRDSTSPVKKLPTIHKALLKMSMENVIKDISSISDNSWTYKDQLVVESRILKVMRPYLCLNPKPVQNIFSGESMTKKLNLEIPWNLEKMKLVDASETGRESSIIPASGMGDMTYGSSPSLALQDGGVPYFQKTTIPSSNPHSVEDNILQETILPKECGINHPSRLREPSTLVFSEKGGCKKQAQGPILKKPKEEPAGFSLHKLSGSESKTTLAPETQQEKQLLQNCDSEKIPQRRVDGENQSSPKVMDGQEVNLVDIPKLQSGVLACPVKQESEFSNIYRPDRSHSYQKSEMHHSSSLSKTNFPANAIHLNDKGNPVERYLSKAVTYKRIPLQKPVLSTALESASVNVNSSPRDSLSRESSVLGKRKLNSNPQRPSMNIVESFPSIRNVNVKTSGCPAGSSSSPSPLRAKDNPILKRFSKIKMVTHRYGLQNGKQKVDEFLDSQPSFKTSLVSYHLNSKDNNSRAGNTDDALEMRMLNFVRSSHFGKGNEASVHVGETQRTLVLSKKCNEGTVEGRVAYGRGKEIDAADSPSESTFVSTHDIDKFAAEFISQMAREGFFLSGDKVEYCPGTTEQGFSSQLPNASVRATPEVGTVMPPCPTPTPIPGQTPFVFMQTPKPRQVSSQDFLTSGDLLQQGVNIGGATSATGRLEPPSQFPIPGQSPYMLSPVTYSTPVLNPSQLPYQNALSGSQTLPSANIWSALQPSANYSSNPLPKNAARISPLQLHWQQIIRNRILLQFQRQRRQRQQQLLMKRNLMMGGLPAASGNLGMMRLGVGTQGPTNPNLGYLANFMDIGGPSSVPNLGNLGQVNTLGNNILGFNGSSHVHGGISDSPDAVLARMVLAQNQQRSLLRGVPAGMTRQPPILHASSSRAAMHPSILPHYASYNIPNHQQLQTVHRNAGITPMHPPTVPTMARNSPGQQLTSAQIHEQLYMAQLQLQYQRMITTPFQGQSSLQQHSHQLQAPETVALSFPHVGSWVGSNESSAMVASDELGGISSEAYTGGI